MTVGPAIAKVRITGYGMRRAGRLSGRSTLARTVSTQATTTSYPFRGRSLPERYSRYLPLALRTKGRKLDGRSKCSNRASGGR